MTSETDVKYVRITDFDDNGIPDGHEFVTAEVVESRYALQVGDILFARSGATVGKTYLYTGNIGAAIFAGYCIRFRFNPALVLPEFVYIYTKTRRYQTWVKSIQRPSGQPNINKEEFKSFTIPLPPLEIQRALVAEMEAARESRQGKLNEADALLKSLDAWLLAQLGLEPPPADERKVFAVRLGTVQSRLDSQFHLPRFQKILQTIAQTQHYPLGNLASFSYEVWNPAEATKRGDTTFRYIEISGVNRETGEARAEEVPILEAPSRARMLVEDGDIIVSLTRPHHGSVAQIDASLDGCIASTGFAVIRHLDETRITADYLWATLRTQLCLQQMLQRSSGGNYPAITEDELAKVFVPAPDLPMQVIIAAEVHRRRADARRLHAEAEAEWQKAKERFERQLLAGR